MHLYVMTLKESNRYGLDLMSVFFVEILTDGLRKVNTGLHLFLQTLFVLSYVYCRDGCMYLNVFCS